MSIDNRHHRPQPNFVFLDGIEVTKVDRRDGSNYFAEDPGVSLAAGTGTTIEETHRRANIAIARKFIRKP